MSKKRVNKRIERRDHPLSMPWDNLMMQFIVLLLILLALAIGAAYYAPSENLAGGATTIEGETTVEGFIGAQQNGKVGSLSAIECDDGIDNDGDGLIDLEDSQCKNRYDVSESIF